MGLSDCDFLDRIRESITRCQDLNCLLGFDGTVDVICKPIERRDWKDGTVEAFSRIKDFGQRIVDADDKSALIEIVPETEKIGGNGPIMANALAASVGRVDYIGPLGKPELHEAFASFAERVGAHSIGKPAVTHALEFTNGKVMLSSISSYAELDETVLISELGDDALRELIANAQLCCVLNWTCFSRLDRILDWILDTILPPLGEGKNRTFFFDLSDPSARSEDELRDVLGQISRFARYGQCVLGMNLNEAIQVSKALGLEPPESQADSLKTALSAIREKLGIDVAMGHPTHFAACATAEGSWAVDGPYTEDPKITTGAGDHLNAGFCLGLALELSMEDALRVGVLFSGYYVRDAAPPSLAELIRFAEEL